MLKSIFRALQAATLLQGFTRSPTHVATPPPEGSVSRCRNGRAAGGQRSAGWSRTPRTHLDRAHATHSITHARSHARRNARARDPACTCTHAQIGAIRSFLCVHDAKSRTLKRSPHQRSHHDRCGRWAGNPQRRGVCTVFVFPPHLDYLKRCLHGNKGIMPICLVAKLANLPLWYRRGGLLGAVPAIRG